MSGSLSCVGWRTSVLSTWHSLGIWQTVIHLPDTCSSLYSGPVAFPSESPKETSHHGGILGTLGTVLQM